MKILPISDFRFPIFLLPPSLAASFVAACRLCQSAIGNRQSAILTLAFAAFLLPFAARSATVITGTLTITNAANISPTTAHSITVDTGTPDTRTWTNAVVTAATQILYSNSVTVATQRLLTHAATYPFAYCYLSQTAPSNIVLRAYNDYPLTITLTNTTWGYVTYATNTITAATVVRVPNTVESAATKTNVANGLVTYINLAANTTAIDQTATVASQLTGLGNVQTITGAKNMSATGNLWTGTQLTLNHSALAVDNALTNYWVDLASNAYRTITPTANIFFQATTNRVATRTVVVRIDPNGTNRLLGFNSSWTFLGIAPTNIVTPNIGILSLTSFGTAETDVLAAYAVENAGFGSTDIDTSAELAAILTDETGTAGGVVFSASPTFTGTVTFPTPWTLGAVSVLPTGTELNFVDGVTSAIQTQLDAKAPSASPTFTGNLTFEHSALTPDSALTNFVANCTGPTYRTITATDDVYFLQSTNRAAVRNTTYFIDPNGTNRLFGLNASWKLLSTIPTTVTNGTVGVLSLIVKGTSETNVYATWSITQ